MSSRENITNFSIAASSESLAENNDYVICPYDKAHRILPWRLTVHLIRCARNHSNSDLVRCPFNSTHLVKPEKLQSHFDECDFRKTYMHFRNPDKLPPTEPHVSTIDLIETSENWDEEPPVPSYNPQAYCEKNPIIRNLQGVPPSARKKFRENERRRLKELK